MTMTQAARCVITLVQSGKKVRVRRYSGSFGVREISGEDYDQNGELKRLDSCVYIDECLLEQWGKNHILELLRGI